MSESVCVYVCVGCHKNSKLYTDRLLCYARHGSVARPHTPPQPPARIVISHCRARHVKQFFSAHKTCQLKSKTSQDIKLASAARERELCLHSTQRAVDHKLPAHTTHTHSNIPTHIEQIIIRLKTVGARPRHPRPTTNKINMKRLPKLAKI